MKHKQNGFTLIEIIVVIVVIGVLARILLGAYSGVQQRAENSKTTAAGASYVRALLSYAQSNSAYPAAASACMADANNTCALVAGSGTPCFGVGAANRVTAFDTEIKTIVSSLPQVSDQSMTCATGSYQGGYFWGPDTKNINMYFFLKGDQTCPSYTGIASPGKTLTSNITLCSYAFPAL